MCVLQTWMRCASLGPAAGPGEVPSHGSVGGHTVPPDASEYHWAAAEAPTAATAA